MKEKNVEFQKLTAAAKVVIKMVHGAGSITMTGIYITECG